MPSILVWEWGFALGAGLVAYWLVLGTFWAWYWRRDERRVIRQIEHDHLWME